MVFSRTFRNPRATHPVAMARRVRNSRVPTRPTSFALQETGEAPGPDHTGWAPGVAGHEGAIPPVTPL